MANQLIIKPDGQMVSLRPKSGEGIDLRTLGKCSCVRSSEIEFDENTQMWYIRFLKDGDFTGIVTHGLVMHYLPNVKFTKEEMSEQPLLFDDYESAVTCEIVLIESIRMKHGSEAV